MKAATTLCLLLVFAAAIDFASATEAFEGEQTTLYVPSTSGKQLVGASVAAWASLFNRDPVQGSHVQRCLLACCSWHTNLQGNLANELLRPST